MPVTPLVQPGPETGRSRSRMKVRSQSRDLLKNGTTIRTALACSFTEVCAAKLVRALGDALFALVISAWCQSEASVSLRGACTHGMLTHHTLTDAVSAYAGRCGAYCKLLVKYNWWHMIWSVWVAALVRPSNCYSLFCDAVCCVSRERLVRSHLSQCYSIALGEVDVCVSPELHGLG